MVDNQVRATDLLVNAVEYRSSFEKIRDLDTVYFRLLYLPGGSSGLLPFSVVIPNSDYMQYRDQLRQNLTVTFDTLNYSLHITPHVPVIRDMAKEATRDLPSIEGLCKSGFGRCVPDVLLCSYRWELVHEIPC